MKKKGFFFNIGQENTIMSTGGGGWLRFHPCLLIQDSFFNKSKVNKSRNLMKRD